MENIPHNREAEEAVVGSVIIDPECMRELGLQADQFYIHRHRFIWESFQRLQESNTPIDFLTITNDLEKEGNLEEIGGPAYLTALMNQVPSSANVKAYAALVVKKATDRRYLTIANDLAVFGYDESDDKDIAGILDRLIKTKPVEGGAQIPFAALKEIDGEVEERIKNPADVWGIPTDIIDWDRSTGGLHPQETTLLVGPPQVGKTTLLLQVGLHISIELHRHVAIYEMEMDTKRLLYRAIFMLGGPSPRKLKTGRFTDGDHARYTKAIEKLDTPYLHISDNPMMTTSHMRADLANLRAKYPIELVLVDYMNLFADSDGKDDNERAKLRSRRFRAICREANVSGISIQSLNKAGIEKAIADIQDVSGPAEIGYDADWMYTMAREEDNVKLIPLKGRDADEVSGVINLLKRGLRFENVVKEKSDEKKPEPKQELWYRND